MEKAFLEIVNSNRALIFKVCFMYDFTTHSPSNLKYEIFEMDCTSKLPRLCLPASLRPDIIPRRQNVNKDRKPAAADDRQPKTAEPRNTR